MKKWKEYYLKDLSRYGGVKVEKDVKKLLKSFRKCQFASGKISSLIAKYKFRTIKRKLGIELFGKTNIGEGLYLGHAYGITINSEAKIGKNCNIHKGVLIGQENRGERKGAPVIGNNVWIGAGSVVTKSIPDNTLAYGVPCNVIRKIK